MLRIAYKMTNGRASDIRFIKDDHVLLSDEYSIQGDVLPSPEELNHPDILKEDRVVEIKAEAGTRIVILAGPGWKQRNMLARYLELLSEKADGGTLSADEITELNSLKAIWTRVKDIRTVSNGIEEEISNLSTREKILDYDIKTNGLWPN